MSKYVDFKEMGKKLAQMKSPTQDWWPSEQARIKADEVSEHQKYMQAMQAIYEKQMVQIGAPIWKVDAGSNSAAYDGPTDT